MNFWRRFISWTAIWKPRSSTGTARASRRLLKCAAEPALRMRPAVLDHAFAFAPASTLTLDELLASNVRLRGLEIFPATKLN